MNEVAEWLDTDEGQAWSLTTHRQPYPQQGVFAELKDVNDGGEVWWPFYRPYEPGEHSPVIAAVRAAWRRELGIVPEHIPLQPGDDPCGGLPLGT